MPSRRRKSRRSACRDWPSRRRSARRCCAPAPPDWPPRCRAAPRSARPGSSSRVTSNAPACPPVCRSGDRLQEQGSRRSRPSAACGRRPARSSPGACRSGRRRRADSRRSRSGPTAPAGARQHAAEHVGRAAGRERHDDAHLAGRENSARTPAPRRAEDGSEPKAHDDARSEHEPASIVDPDQVESFGRRHGPHSATVARGERGGEIVGAPVAVADRTSEPTIERT